MNNWKEYFEWDIFTWSAYESLRILFNMVDKLIVFFVPARLRYKAYGYAIK